MKKIDNRIEYVKFSCRKIKRTTRKIAKQISSDYQGKCPIFLGILKGAIPFYAQLLKSITIDCETEFVKCESYSGTKQVKDVEVIWNKPTEIKGRDIIIVDEVLDSGKTMVKLIEILKDMGAVSVKVAVMADKPSNHKVDIKPDYCCFNIGDEFLVGFGLDWNGIMRNLPYVGVLKKEYFDK